MMSFEHSNQLSQMHLVRSMVAVACLDWLECDAAHLIPYGFTFTLEQVALLLELEVELAMAQIPDGTTTESKAIAFYLTMLDPDSLAELSDTGKILLEDYLDTFSAVKCNETPVPNEIRRGLN